jgi:hypothetical protein
LRKEKKETEKRVTARKSSNLMIQCHSHQQQQCAARIALQVYEDVHAYISSQNANDTLIDNKSQQYRQQHIGILY